MTKNFDKVCESIIRETLVGSKKRNKVAPKNPGMGRKGGRARDLKHARPMPRQLKSHPAHIRPTQKVTGNETGVHSKRPDSKPVYAKNGVKPMVNKSQRSLTLTPRAKGGTPYSANHMARGTQRRHLKRKEKLLKAMKTESNRRPNY